MEYTSYAKFKEEVVDNHLGKHYNIWKQGIWPGNKSSYPHIVAIPGKTQIEIVKAIIENDGCEFVPELFPSPHKYAHHLNSSQVVCYEFFKPYVDYIAEKSCTKTKPEVPHLLVKMGFEGAFAQQFFPGFAEFEWIPDKTENTNFDFYLHSSNSNKKIYFEIKYTEQGFGTCRNDEEHKIKFDTIYKEMIEKCACLLKKPTVFDEEWRKNYQLFRNVLRITNNNWENEYVVFLFPKMNKAAKAHFERFKVEYINPAFDEHIKEVFWEDLTDTEYMSNKFRQKFFFYAL
ncbi:MAG: hypothetical protein IKX60_03455 [Bacteroidales bacterium]|nr:hypothetical protein [Bacteroidales bacterium]